MRVKNLGGTSLVILHAVFTSSKEWGGRFWLAPPPPKWSPGG